MVGYAEDHAAGTYRIYMLSSNHVIQTRDVQWLNIFYGKWSGDGMKQAEFIQLDELNDDDEEFYFNQASENVNDDASEAPSSAASIPLDNIPDDDNSIFGEESEEDEDDINPYAKKFYNHGPRWETLCKACCN